VSTGAPSGKRDIKEGGKEGGREGRRTYPTRSCSCRRASTKGILSMSPTVPPSSITHTSGASPVSSTG